MRSRNKDDERVLDIKATPKGMALKPDGKLAAVDLAAASGETLEGVVELQKRLVKVRDSIARAAEKMNG